MKKWLMKFRHDILRALPAILSGLVVVWCGFYLLFGSSNIFVLRTLKGEEAQLTGTLDTLVAQRSDIEDRVVRMRPNSLDWDLVEQQSQLKLGPPVATKSLKM